jgi:hypothetical protein
MRRIDFGCLGCRCSAVLATSKVRRFTGEVHHCIKMEQGERGMCREFRVPDAIAQLETSKCCFPYGSQGAVLADNRLCRQPPGNINRFMDEHEVRLHSMPN